MSRIPRRHAALVVVAAGALGLAGCVVSPEVVQPPPCGALSAHPLPQCAQAPGVDITSVTFSQSQAVPDFDDGTYAVTDDAALDSLQVVLSGVTRDLVLTGDCDGGRTTEVVVESQTASTFTIVVDTCSDDSLAQEVDDLVARWHADGVAQPVQ